MGGRHDIPFFIRYWEIYMQKETLNLSPRGCYQAFKQFVVGQAIRSIQAMTTSLAA